VGEVGEEVPPAVPSSLSTVAAAAAAAPAPAPGAPAPAPAPAAFTSYPPLIDLEAFADDDGHSSAAQQQQKQNTAEALRRACIDVGFFWVKSRALSRDTNGGRDVIADAFAATRALFDLPQSKKDACDATCHPLFRTRARQRTSPLRPLPPPPPPPPPRLHTFKSNPKNSIDRLAQT
jgi:hypothetical protein